MHMARDSRDAKRQLATAGVVPKMRDVVEIFEPNSPTATALVVPAISCLVNIAIDSEYWGQAELAEEGVLHPIKRAFETAPPTTQLSQVCAVSCTRFARTTRKRLRRARSRAVARGGVPPPPRSRG